MLKFLGRLLLWLRSGTLNLLLLAIGLLLLWGVFAPAGTLVWWLQQEPGVLGFNQTSGVNRSTHRNLTAVDPSRRDIHCYVVFLTGIGDFSANQLTPGEEFFLGHLAQEHRNCAIVSDVFPYSVANVGLGGQRLLAPLWKFAENADGWLENIDFLIKGRNVWRFAISVDNRYGKVYNQGIADAIIDRMDAAYPIESDRQHPLNLILIGTSGGAQVALGSVPYLNRWLNAKITVVSVGGVFSGTDGFSTVKHLYHLQGSQDWVEDIGRFVFPSRWPGVLASPFNQAMRQGRVTKKEIGPQSHDGDSGYFGEQRIENSNTMYVEQTLKAVNQLPIWENERGQESGARNQESEVRSQESGE
ncbi:MAG TPA: hypothetical protein V6C78_06860 [Crinalium sp.]|jgi:hypothetical protein